MAFKLYNDGEIWQYGKLYAKVYADGDVYKDGNLFAKIYADGEIWQDGKKIGRIYDDGDVWIDGRNVGKIQIPQASSQVSSDHTYNTSDEVSTSNDRTSSYNHSNHTPVSYTGGGIGWLLLAMFLAVILVGGSFQMWISGILAAFLNYATYPILAYMAYAVVFIAMIIGIFIQITRFEGSFIAGLLLDMVIMFIALSLANCFIYGFPWGLLIWFVDVNILGSLFLLFVLALDPALIGFVIAKILDRFL